VAYLIGGQEHHAGNTETMRECLKRALEYLGRAAAVWPGFTGIAYLKAKCHALLDQRKETIEQFELLSDLDRRYYRMACEDGDFNRIRDEIERVFQLALDKPGPLARAAETRLEEVRQSLLWAKLNNSATSKDRSIVYSVEHQYLDQARGRLRTLEVNIEDLSKELLGIRRRLEKIASDGLRNRVASIESQIWSVSSTRSSCEASIRDLNEKMKLTKGRTAVGCLLFFAFYLGSGFALMLFFALSFDEKTIRQFDASGVTRNLIFVAMGIGVVGFFVGKAISRRHRISPLQKEVEEQNRRIYDAEKPLPELQGQLQASRKELDDFLAWSTRMSPHPSPSS